MAVLAFLMDVTRTNTLAGVTSTTYNHSLATNPDLTLAVVRSVASATAYSQLCAIGANASIATVNLQQASTGAAHVTDFDLWNIYFHSEIR